MTDSSPSKLSNVNVCFCFWSWKPKTFFIIFLTIFFINSLFLLEDSAVKMVKYRYEIATSNAEATAKPNENAPKSDEVRETREIFRIETDAEYGFVPPGYEFWYFAFLVGFNLIVATNHLFSLFSTCMGFYSSFPCAVSAYLSHVLMVVSFCSLLCEGVFLGYTYYRKDPGWIDFTVVSVFVCFLLLSLMFVYWSRQMINCYKSFKEQESPENFEKQELNA